MPFFPELNDNAKTLHGFLAFDTGMERPLLDMQQAIMRSEGSPLTIGQRELMAAYVSSINACRYSQGAHTATAVEFGIEPSLVEELLENINTANVEENLKPIFKFIRKLTIELHNMVQADADAVFNAGWTSRALYDAIAVCCAFSFMNRYANGLGLEANPDDFLKEGQMLKESGYTVSDLLKLK